MTEGGGNEWAFCCCPPVGGVLVVQTDELAFSDRRPAHPDGRTGVLRGAPSLFQGGQTEGCQAAVGVTVHRSASSLAPLLCLIMAGNHNNISACWKQENESAKGLITGIFHRCLRSS